MLELKRTGRKVAFLDLQIGNPFWAHRRVWIRTDGNSATELKSSGELASCCDFLIDGTVHAKRQYGFPDMERCEEVEAVEFISV